MLQIVVMHVNVNSQPHTDPGDSDRLHVVMHICQCEIRPHTDPGDTNRLHIYNSNAYVNVNPHLHKPHGF